MTCIICNFPLFTFETFLKPDQKQQRIGESRGLRIIGKSHDAGEPALNQRADVRSAQPGRGLRGLCGGPTRMLISNAQLRVFVRHCPFINCAF
ncbi:hypothetical protein LJ656_00335 [Paraburkholderia sp. MMS20-SJTR3]|uniref:Uncharacterized protein n=1 Tax=Paraburkholderia sejongensis TaxID=2886946 RepID=A0ABS8JMN2_9BURK|nr:hypothetical protein [Paraburkholderia sp. MMS20-SJTR3]MCC8391020.1 hypothetical protein [Paraburkholderia sp. MMS20-SJTR3]